MKALLNRQTFRVLDVLVDVLTMETALHRLHGLLKAEDSSYVCATAVHGVVEAQDDPELLAAYEGAAMNLPDGMPLVWEGWRQGHQEMHRVAGPDLMWQVFRRPQFRSLTHFFYGGKPGVAEELRDRFREHFRSAAIVGTYTPPFRDLTFEEEELLESKLNRLRPDVVWIGIGCPRQELFMARHAQRWNAKVMIGVGAAFDFHTGRIRGCAPWIQCAGLQWLHRLIQDPRRLWRRYLITNTRYLCRIALQIAFRSPISSSVHPRLTPDAKKRV